MERTLSWRLSPDLFPNTLQTGTIAHLGGGGGENHRPFYGQFLGTPAPEAFVARRAGNIVQRSARRGFASVQHAIDRITEGRPDHLDALTCHYWHFRNRFHAGREPQYSVKFQPLASRLLDGVAAVAGRARFHNAQMLYDILYNLAPDLLHFSFDRWRKRPGHTVRRNLTSMAVDRSPAGRCFIEEVRPLPGQTRRGKESTRAIDCLSEDFCSAKSGSAVEFLGADYVRVADRALRTAIEKGSFSTPVQSKRVAVVLACTLFES